MTQTDTYIQTLWLLESPDLLDRETENEGFREGFKKNFLKKVENSILGGGGQRGWVEWVGRLMSIQMFTSRT